MLYDSEFASAYIAAQYTFFVIIIIAGIIVSLRKTAVKRFTIGVKIY